MRLLCVLLFVLNLVLVSSTEAQQTISMGSRVRLLLYPNTERSTQITGTITNIGDSTLAITYRDPEWGLVDASFATHEVRGISVSAGHVKATRYGLVLGAAIGTVVGLVYEQWIRPDPQNLCCLACAEVGANPMELAVGGMIGLSAGAILGAGIGSFGRREVWRTLDIRAGVRMVPSATQGGVVISIRSSLLVR